jgi:hypothetical protein
MAFSIWEYIRGRARDAVLAGFDDALDAVEQDDADGRQHGKADELRAKLNPPKELPAPPTDGASGTAADEAEGGSGAEEAPQSLPGESLGDEDLDSRLSAAGPQNAQARPDSPTGLPHRRKRGRPPKSEGRQP